MKRPYLVALSACAAACAHFSPPESAQQAYVSQLEAPPPPEKFDGAQQGAAALAFGQAGPDEDVRGLDLNGDNKSDAFIFYKKGMLPPEISAEEAVNKAPSETATELPDTGLLRKEYDLNGDRRLDLVTVYNEDGSYKQQSYDLDFDGRIDVITYYEKNVILRKDYFHDFGDKADTYKFYEKGKLARVERDSNHDGKVDTWEYWLGDEVERVGMDMNGDGQVDQWRRMKGK